jgi:hypothetical protein
MDKTSLNAFIRENISGTIIFNKLVVGSCLETYALVVNQIIYFGIHVVCWNSEEEKFKVNKITTSTTQSDAINILMTMYSNIKKLKSGELFAHADVVRCHRKYYEHFAIYDNVRDCFYEYQKPDGDWNSVKICQTSGHEFMLREYDIIPTVVKYQDTLPDTEVIQRARSRIGVQGYHLLYRNCQHFATWCKLGNSDSTGVSSLLARVEDGTFIIQASGFVWMIIKALFNVGRDAVSGPLVLIVLGAGILGLGLTYAVNSRNETSFD